MFVTTDEDLKVGDLVRVWSGHVRPSPTNRDTYSELAIVARYHRPNVSVMSYWLFWNGKRGLFSCEDHRVELVR